MKLNITILLFFILTSCGQSIPKHKNNLKSDQYEIILKTKMLVPEKDPETGELYSNEIPGAINTKGIEKLNEPLKALAAFYSAMGGSMCNGEYCDLTTALGLGKQGSEEHKNLIKKYFPTDKVAETIIKQNCYLRPSGASTFTDYEFLTITDKGDTVYVDYKLMGYDRGDIQWTEGPDIYLFKDNKYKKLKRNLWKFADK